MAGRLRIVHLFRAPVGGLFRHVRDLARAQSEAGHDVGVICGTSQISRKSTTALTTISTMDG